VTGSIQLNNQPAARKQWDKSEWEAKAKAKDEEYAQKAKATEAALAKGEAVAIGRATDYQSGSS